MTQFKHLPVSTQSITSPRPLVNPPLQFPGMWKSCLSFLFLSRSPCSQLYLLEMKSINVAVSGQKKRKAKRRCNCTRLAIIREVSSSRKVLGTWRKELFLVRLAWPHNAPITSQHCAQDKKCGMEDELGEDGCWLIYRAGRSSLGATCHTYSKS